jgi:hypothetical protein
MITSTYVDNISSGKVSKELIVPANKHRYIRSESKRIFYSSASKTFSIGSISIATAISISLYSTYKQWVERLQAMQMPPRCNETRSVWLVILSLLNHSQSLWQEAL